MKPETSTNQPDPSQTLPPVLVVFDGECGLCDFSVQRLLNWDSQGILRFTPAQGDTFAEIHKRHPQLRPLDSITLVINDGSAEQVYTHSTAMFKITSYLGWPYRSLAAFSVLPRVFTDSIYRLIAKYRIALFGRPNSCRMPTPQERIRFLA